MKTNSIIKLVAVVLLSCCSLIQVQAQPGDFEVVNASAVSVTVVVFADIDECTGAFSCSTAPVVIAAGSSFIFNSCTQGAWKGFRVFDTCGGTTVGVCPTTLPTNSSFTSCGGTVTVDWIDEHYGEIN